MSFLCYKDRSTVNAYKIKTKLDWPAETTLDE